MNTSSYAAVTPELLQQKVTESAEMQFNLEKDEMRRWFAEQTSLYYGGDVDGMLAMKAGALNRKEMKKDPWLEGGVARPLRYAVEFNGAPLSAVQISPETNELVADAVFNRAALEATLEAVLPEEQGIGDARYKQLTELLIDNYKLDAADSLGFNTLSETITKAFGQQPGSVKENLQNSLARIQYLVPQVVAQQPQLGAAFHDVGQKTADAYREFDLATALRELTGREYELTRHEQTGRYSIENSHACEFSPAQNRANAILASGNPNPYASEIQRLIGKGVRQREDGSLHAVPSLSAGDFISPRAAWQTYHTIKERREVLQQPETLNAINALSSAGLQTDGINLYVAYSPEAEDALNAMKDRQGRLALHHAVIGNEIVVTRIYPDVINQMIEGKGFTLDSISTGLDRQQSQQRS